MSYRKIISIAFVQAVLTVLYVAFATWALFQITGRLDAGEDKNTPFLGVVGILLLLVISAGISGSLVFGYSILLTVKQRVKEAVLLALATVGFLFLICLLGMMTFIVVLPA